ncbi:hypothetical protein GCM10023201_58390 [Actinomycetospora corticicola]|uniref:Uncharacterized protein n=1 Tax=Actinomycetospora corticicola TaxID=663602 RepID=A0A7Y9DSP3_9PSEU|nr:hypothetical protein [Actinomycetospora corticicola]NYD34664.1 hypothetical protein [Actinomycetospora corticicola]
MSEQSTVTGRHARPEPTDTPSTTGRHSAPEADETPTGNDVPVRPPTRPFEATAPPVRTHHRRPRPRAKLLIVGAVAAVGLAAVVGMGAALTGDPTPAPAAVTATPPSGTPTSVTPPVAAPPVIPTSRNGTRSASPAASTSTRRSTTARSTTTTTTLPG